MHQASAAGAESGALGGADRFDPRDVWRVLVRYRWRGAAFFLSVVTLVAVGLVVCPREYASEAKLLVRLGRENVVLDPTVTTGAVVAPNSTREAEINSVIEVLRSRAIAEKVLDLVGPEVPVTTPIERERALKSLRDDLNVWSPRMSTVVAVSAEAQTPERAQQIAQAMIDVYTQEHLRVNRTPGSYEFFTEQSELLTQQLAAADAELRDAKNRYGIVSLETRRTALQEQLSGIETQINETDAALAASEAKLAALGAQLAGLPSPLARQLIGGTPDGGLANMRERLFELQTREQEALAKFTEDHPEVIAIRRQARQVERILGGETPTQHESNLAVLANEQSLAASLRGKARSLRDQLAAAGDELQELNEQELHITALQRRIKLLDANYMTYSQSLEQARIDGALKSEGISNISVVQPASFVPKPHKPRKLLTAAAGLAAATAGALGLMFLSSYLDQLPSLPRDRSAPSSTNHFPRAQVGRALPAGNGK